MGSITRSSTARHAPAPAEPELRPLIPPHVWARIALLTLLLVPLHWDLIWRIVGVVPSTGDAPDGLVASLLAPLHLRPFGYAWTSGDWSHALLIPFISLYFISQHADTLRTTRAKTCWWGLPIALAGLAGYFLALYPLRSDMLKGDAAILELFGIVLLFVGPSMMRVLWFPIVYLAFAIRISDGVWDAVAWKLQNIAAGSATVLLTLFGIDAQIRGTTIELYHGLQKLGSGLNVAQACSGLRMLMTFAALGVAMAYLWERPWWARLTLVLLTVPIAIAVNVGRVTLLGLLYLVNPAYSQGDFHIFMGMLMLIPAGAMFWGVGWLLNLLVEDQAEALNEPRP